MANISYQINNRSIGYANTTGGLRGAVYNVSTAAQLRTAIEASGRRYVKILAGGEYLFSSSLMISNPNITIDGRFASSPFWLRCAPGYTDNHLLGINTNDVILSHLHIAPGVGGAVVDVDSFESPGFFEVDAITMTGSDGGEARNIWIDHCTGVYSNDSIFEIWGGLGGAHDITISNCLMAYALNRSTHSNTWVWNGSAWVSTFDHGFAVLIGNGAFNVSLINNVYAHCGGRVPRVQDAWNVEQIGDVVYNAINDTPEFDLTGSNIDPSGNYEINQIGTTVLGNGPNTNQGASNQPRYSASIVDADFTIYLEGNRCDKRTADTDPEANSATGETGSVTGVKNSLSGYPITRLAESNARFCASNAGATVPARMAVASNAITDVINALDGSPSGSIVDTEAEAGGWA